jgi:hypothetical protein
MSIIKKYTELKAKNKILVLEETEIWFDPNVWNIIKQFAGYSNNYPSNLPYYKLMLGINDNIHYKAWFKNARYVSLDLYIKWSQDYSDMYESFVNESFAPINWNSY